MVKKGFNSLRDMVYAISGTVVVADVGWGESLPDWIMGEIKLERLAMNMRALKGEKVEAATDAEALAYLFTLSLKMPISNEVAEVYFYLCKRYMPQMPSGVGRDALTPAGEKILENLKRDIYRTSRKAFEVKLEVTA